MSFVLPSGATIERDAPLASLTSWVVGGSADYYIQPRTLDDLKEALAWGRVVGIPVTILGGGTNVLISDRGVRGLTIALRKLAGAQVSVDEASSRVKLDCLAGTSKSELLKTFLKYKLEPALFLAGLPGDTGGGVVMNAGVGEMIKPREFVEITDWVEVLRWKDGYSSPTAFDGSVKEVPLDDILAATKSLDLINIPASKLTWSYRHCEGWRPGVIARVGLSWPNQPSDDVLQRVRSANQVRLSKQPLDMPSCGSVFVNPPGHKSGQLIESSGLKGFAIGGAKVSEKHANFIVNFNKAKAVDIHQVIAHVKATVFARSGVELRTEVVYLGDWQGA